MTCRKSPGHIGFLAFLVLGLNVICIHTYKYSASYESEANVNEGDSFTIKCHMDNRARPKWTLNGTEILPKNDAGFLLSQKQNRAFDLEMILHVESAQTHHEGEYRCNAMSRDYYFVEVITTEEEEESDEDDLEEDEGRRILKKDDGSDDKDAESDRILKVNENIKLFCRSGKDEKSITWYRRGRKIVGGVDSSIVISGKYLTIEKAQEDDAGEYMCRVEELFQTGLTDIGRIFQIKTPAKIINFPVKKSIIEGESLELHCEVYGHPKPRITWYIDNEGAAELSKSDPRIRIYSQSSHDNVLNVGDVKSSDSGMYTCRVENSIDKGESLERDEESVFIHVRENMIETNEDEPGMGKLLTPGEQLILHCNTTECLHCNVIWFKDERQLYPVDDHIKIYDNNSVVINDASYNDTGVYICAIDKGMLDVALNASIPVRTEIKLQKFDTSSVIVQGNKLELYCIAKGAPAPTIKWFKGDNEITDTDERIKLVDFEGLKNAKLFIEEVDFEDREYYTCEAYNQVNADNTTILIRIKDKLAALWPFLGICAEVAILCSIIFIYERRKSKSEIDEPDTDHPTENKSLQDQKPRGQDIRQRK